MKRLKTIMVLVLLTFSNFFGWSNGEIMSSFSNSEGAQNIVIPAVDVNCVRVETNGDISLDWTPAIAGTGVFVEYQLFCIQLGAIPIATFSNINTSTYTHAGAGGNLSSNDYYIATISDCNSVLEMRYSDTISSIFLEINDLGDGRVFVEWNPTHNPQFASENINYTILREFPAGNWQVRKTIPYGQFNYRDTIDICSAFINYKIEVANSAGCKSASNIEGGLFQDIINPYIPVVSYVSVDTLSQNATIFWNQNQSSDTYGYIILKLINGFWENIDTVYGIGTTSYIDFGSIEDVQSETYAVAAFDSCIVSNVPPNYQTSAASPSHSTIFLESVINLCDLKLSLYWTSYNGWVGNDALDRYEVLLKKGNGPFEVIQTLTSDKAGFNYSGLQNYEKYCFYIRAVSSSGLYSYSNQVCKIIIPPANPKFHYLSMASHILGDELELEFYTDPNAKAVSYEVYKKGPKDFEFSVVNTIPPSATSFYSFYDNAVKDRGYYEYKIGIIDSCNNTSLLTPITKTIYLSLNTDFENFTNTLTWTDYEGFAGQKTGFNIYRGENGVYDPNPVGSTLPGIRSFTDDLSSEFSSEGGFCYRVEAVEATNKYGFSRTAFSNEVCMTLEPVAIIPSAIVLNGVNNVFRPVISLYDFDSYEMEIFNRWGERLFFSNEIANGWKGITENGGEVMEGVYVYRVTFSDVEGKRYEKTGTLMVLKK